MVNEPAYVQGERTRATRYACQSARTGGGHLLGERLAEDGVKGAEGPVEAHEEVRVHAQRVEHAGELHCVCASVCGGLRVSKRINLVETDRNVHGSRNCCG